MILVWTSSTPCVIRLANLWRAFRLIDTTINVREKKYYDLRDVKK
jgi:hypothetical protein